MAFLTSTPDLERRFESVEEIRAIRADLRDLLAGSDREFVDATLLATSELLTNAVMHTDDGCRFAAWFQLAPVAVRVEVDDFSTTPPSLNAAVPTDGAGRGMYLVAAVTTRWGVETRPGGKTVWFENAPTATTARLADSSS